MLKHNETIPEQEMLLDLTSNRLISGNMSEAAKKTLKQSWKGARLYSKRCYCVIIIQNTGCSWRRNYVIMCENNWFNARLYHSGSLRDSTGNWNNTEENRN